MSGGGSVYPRGKGKNRSWWIKVEIRRDYEVSDFVVVGGMVLPIVKEKRIRRQMRGGVTKAEAQAKLVEIQSAKNSGTYIEPTKLTFGQYLTDIWLPAIESTVRVSTFTSYRQNITRHVIPGLGSIPLQTLSADDLDAFYSDLSKKGLSVGTIKNIHVAVRKSLNDALRKNRIVRNVAQAATLPKRTTRKPEMKSWTDEQLRTFLEFVKGHRLFAAFYLLAATGLRRGEALGLHWNGVDLDKGEVTVSQALVQVNQDAAFEDTKNGLTRKVSINAETVAVLKAWRKAQMEERVAIGPGYIDSGLVFTRLDGSALLPSSFSQNFDRLVARTNLPRIRLHDLRHTHATLMLKKGVSIGAVSRRLGHATPGFTLTVYSHVLPGEDADAAERFGDLLGGAQ